MSDDVSSWKRLRPKLDKLTDLGHALSLMGWDQQVMMPPKGAAARARASATLQSMAHELLTEPAMGDLINELAADDSLDDVQGANVRLLQRDYQKATRLPPDLVRALAEASALSYQTWTEARPASDWPALEPHLRNIVSLKKEAADALGWEGERYDALLDGFEPDMTAARIETTFAELAEGLRPLVEKILDAAGERPSFTSATYDAHEQVELCHWLVARLGFDTEGGRLDTSPHPFTGGIGYGDVRQTTRAEPDNLFGSLYAAIHETGHALYEQGIPPDLAELPAGDIRSLGLHESQSRLWENHVGRSEAFTGFLWKQLKERWPAQLQDVGARDLYAGVNHPKRTLIRVNADEVTYNLHVALRFELELALFRDELDVADLPEAWNDGMEKHLGIRPPNDADGVLQDVHWPSGYFGYFPTYTLGTLYAAGFWEVAEGQLADLQEDLAAGETGRLLEWLRTNIHSQAALRPAHEIAEGVLGGPLSARPFLSYIADKYGALYDLTS